MSNVIAEMEACIPALRRYAGALLRNRQEVDDLVQDCLARALDRLHARREDGDLRAWLFAIMHNLFISRIRSAKVRGTVEPIDALDGASVGQHPNQESHMRGRDLMRALDSLPEDQRSVLLLVAVEGFSYAEVARVTGVPIGTVMSRLSRSRERLRRLLEEEPAPALRRVK
ncbi:MAG: sigma-70 family RNA polymerase sigma factor [Acetobacteraceae bacterium]|nr:sigma-70 family RNA polymerase sigma factor [Acetobacteraceae bacterium]